MREPPVKLDVERFLSEYWQKSPCLIPAAFPGFAPDFDGDDLAGLACEPMAEARIISGAYPQNDWQVREGPFDHADFASLPEEHWTLLVQDVEKHYPPLVSLLEKFDFLPSWRLDDLMISYAAPGGSVGPHVDQYDVFLLQAQGQRRWQIAEHFRPRFVENCSLRVLAEFEPEQEWTLGPGDMLYLPPGIAHHGVALSAGMTWSIGLRAPCSADLLMAMGEQLAQSINPHYTDPGLELATRPGEIDQAALERLRALMMQPLIDEEGFAQFAGTFLTRYRLAHEPAPPETRIDEPTLSKHLAAEGRVMRNPWTRIAWLRKEHGAVLFAAGNPFECSIHLAMALGAQQVPEIPSAAQSGRDLSTLTELINAGHLIMVNEDPETP